MKTKVNIQPAIDLLIKKAAQDKQALQDLISSKEAVEDFDAQADALAAYQGGVRALYVLAGKTTLEGAKVSSGDTKTAIDIADIERQLRATLAGG